MTLDDDRALVLLSGGQDPTTCLAWALDRFSNVETIGFGYGQRHRAELEVRDAIRSWLRAYRAVHAGSLGEDHVVDAGLIGAIAETALTRDVAIAVGAGACRTRSSPAATPCS